MAMAAANDAAGKLDAPAGAAGDGAKKPRGGPGSSDAQALAATRHGMAAALWQTLGHKELAQSVASLQLSHFSDRGTREDAAAAVRARSGCLSALSVLHREPVLWRFCMGTQGA